MTEAEIFPETLLLNVTPQDLKEGIRRECNFCPLARALRRSLGKREDLVIVSACWSSFGVTTQDYYTSYEMPEAGKRFIEAFDAGREVEPIPLEIHRREINRRDGNTPIL